MRQAWDQVLKVKKSARKSTELSAAELTMTVFSYTAQKYQTYRPIAKMWKTEN